MSDDTKKRLMALGAGALADSLVKLAQGDGAAEAMVQRMIATPQESTQRFKAKLAGLKGAEDFVSWREVDTLVDELEDLLEDLKVGVTDPQVGTEMAAAFFETDEATLNRCDDSSGRVGDVYRYSAKDVFVRFAKQRDDKEALVKLVLDLNHGDNFGMRDTLIDAASEYLPKENIRSMITHLEDFPDGNKYVARRRLFSVESLAKQIHDAPLFEKARIASWGTLTAAAYMDIARVYFESGDAKTALSRLEMIPEEETFSYWERDKLLLNVYETLGDAAGRETVAWRIFRNDRSKGTLEMLLAVIGEERGAQVVAEAVAAILSGGKLSLTDAMFLVDMEVFDAAENYLLDHREELNGDFYPDLLQLVEALERAERPLVVSVLYRALLDSILARAMAKAYSYGAHYLKRLDELSVAVSDWKGVPQHVIYKDALSQKHRRKLKFWSLYNGR